MRMRTVITILAAVLAVAGVQADENDWLLPLGSPPKASPRRISGGESFPPLPLPATPLRRSERKREPKAPTLVGKVVWGETAVFTYADGQETRVADWNQCPADLQQLLRKGGRWFGLNYASEAVPLSSFHWDAARTPVLLFSGSRTIRIDEKQIANLRSYVLNGGMLLFDSIAGSPYFYASAKQTVARVLPESRLRVIPADHPVYHMLHDVEKVRYPKNLDSDQPLLEGVYVGSRIGAVVSRYGLGCGWDDHDVPLLEKAVFYDVESATLIGLNLMAYAVGYAGAGREEAKPELFGSLDEKRPTDEFVFAQLRHEGAWNVHPGAAAALLRRLRGSTSLRVSLKRVAVTPGVDDLSDYAFLYLAGLDDFHFDARAVAALKDFLHGSGTLLINNGLGLSTFDRAVRREMKKVLPGAVLAPVPGDHPLFTSVFRLETARYTPALLREKPGLAVPVLEGIAIDGDLRVIYSPYDMEGAWLGCEYPLAKAYEPHSGMQIGINTVLYAVTH